MRMDGRASSITQIGKPEKGSKGCLKATIVACRLLIDGSLSLSVGINFHKQSSLMKSISPLLTPEEALFLIHFKAVNFRQLASLYYGDDRDRPDQALRRRTVDSSKISAATLERLSSVRDTIIDELINLQPPEGMVTKYDSLTERFGLFDLFDFKEGSIAKFAKCVTGDTAKLPDSDYFVVTQNDETGNDCVITIFGPGMDLYYRLFISTDFLERRYIQKGLVEAASLRSEDIEIHSKNRLFLLRVGPYPNRHSELPKFPYEIGELEENLYRAFLKHGAHRKDLAPGKF